MVAPSSLPILLLQPFLLLLLLLPLLPILRRRPTRLLPRTLLPGVGNLWQPCPSCLRGVLVILCAVELLQVRRPGPSGLLRGLPRFMHRGLCCALPAPGVLERRLLAPLRLERLHGPPRRS